MAHHRERLGPLEGVLDHIALGFGGLAQLDFIETLWNPIMRMSRHDETDSASQPF